MKELLLLFILFFSFGCLDDKTSAQTEETKAATAEEDCDDPEKITFDEEEPIDLTRPADQGCSI